MQTKDITRRDFLKYSALFSAGLWLAGNRQTSKWLALRQNDADGVQLGRVLYDDVAIYAQPSQDTAPVRTLKYNEVVEYVDQQEISTGSPHREIWCQLADGNFLAYKNIQPVRNELNEPVTNLAAGGMLAEVTVPSTSAIWDRLNKDQRQKESQMFFYGSTHWVHGLGKDEAGNYYYQVREDRWDDSYYVNATHMRLIAEDELTPTSTEINQTSKVIRINLAEQYLVAYEDEQPVFMSPLSSGQLTGEIDLTTPTGDFKINYKRPSRHMVHSDRIGINDNELYGVPWVSYFTDTGIAFHGTYWHNDFSHPKSHGCINLPIPAARWIYLWTQPVVPPTAEKYVSNSGTLVEVF